MPLKKGAKPGSKGFKENIKAEIAAGKPMQQSVAIAYSEAKEPSKKSIPKDKTKSVKAKVSKAMHPSKK